MVATFQKRWLLIALAVLFIVVGVKGYREEVQRFITPTTIDGTLVDLHTVSHQRGQTLHFRIETSDGVSSKDLHTEDALMYMKAENGQKVRATFTRETGYVSQLAIIAGHDAGYSYSESDRPNVLHDVMFCGIGLVIIAVQIFGMITDRQAES